MDTAVTRPGIGISVPEKFNTDLWQEYCRKQEIYDAMVEEAQDSGNYGKYESELTRRHQELVELSQRWAMEVLKQDGVSVN